MNLYVLIALLAFAPPTPERAAEAKKALAAGTTAYNLGRWKEACTQYAIAYRLVPHPDLLFNIGQCSRKGKKYGQALESYKAYLRTSEPDAPNREAALRHISEVNAELARAQAMPENAQAPPGAVAPLLPAAAPAVALSSQESEAAPLYKRWWFWTAIGAVAAGTATAIALGSSGDGIPDTPLGNQPIFR